MNYEGEYWLLQASLQQESVVHTKPKDLQYNMTPIKWIIDNLILIIYFLVLTMTDNEFPVL